MITIKNSDLFDTVLNAAQLKLVRRVRKQGGRLVLTIKDAKFIYDYPSPVDVTGSSFKYRKS